jgi:hypothetical protein
MPQENQVQGTFKKDKTTKNNHRFQVKTESGEVVGTIYISKATTPIPQELLLKHDEKDD